MDQVALIVYYKCNKHRINQSDHNLIINVNPITASVLLREQSDASEDKLKKRYLSKIKSIVKAYEGLNRGIVNAVEIERIEKGELTDSDKGRWCI